MSVTQGNANASAVTTLSGGVEADSNPGLVPDSADKGVFRAWVEPARSVSWIAGRYEFGADARFRVERSGDKQRLAPRDEWAFAVRGARNTPRGSLGVSASYDETVLTTELFDDTGVVATDETMTRRSVGGRGEHRLTERGRISGHVAHEARRYDVDSLVEQDRAEAGVRYTYRYSRRTDIEWDLEATHYDPVGESSIWQLSAMTGVSHRPNAASDISVRAGITRVPDELGNQVSGSVQGAVWFNERTRGTLAADRRVTMSALAEVTVSDRAQLGLARTLGARTTATLSGTWVRLSEDSSRSLRSLSAGLSHALTPNLSAQLSYRYSELHRDQSAAGTGHLAAFTLTYRHVGL